MELTFTGIRALSSRTRITILEELMQQEMTPSDLSERLDSNTSDVMMQLETLANAGFVEQQPGEGFNTVYTPTKKASTIVDNGTTQATFSIGSAGLAGLLGLGIIGQGTGVLQSFFEQSTIDASASTAQAMPKSGMETAPEITTQATTIDPLFIIGGLLLLAVSGLLLHYGRNLRQLTS